jgi:class 3 adenylate cyclase
LTFTPHPQIRFFHDDTYCIGGPMITPHILIHQQLQPGETRTLRTRLDPGEYRIRTQRPGVEQWLVMSGEGEYEIDQLAIQASAEAIEAVSQHETDADDEGLTLVMSNEADYDQRIYVERAEWYTDAVTAAEVTTLQHFRELFSDAVLRPAEEIGIEAMTILFTDLVGSTAMYNRIGDAPSYALVRDQFSFLQRIVREYDGGIVKTIGDAIMAAFVDPANGVEAALAIQRQVDAFNADHPDQPLKIKLGMHHGPCIAVNLNGRLDYFGTTVNLAARLEGVNKIFQTQIIISEASHELVKEAFICRELDYLRVKGKKEPTRIFELVAPRGRAQESNYHWIDDYHQALEAYRQGSWDKAITLFEALATGQWQDAASQALLERCRYLIKNPPEDWDGVLKLEVK